MYRSILTVTLLLLLAPQAFAVGTYNIEYVNYELDGITMEGFLVYDESLEGPLPGDLRFSLICSGEAGF